MSSSEETIFGDAFFEPLAKAVGRGVASSGTGAVDLIVETDTDYTVVAVKSGPSWANSEQVRKLKQNFQQAQDVFRNKKLRKQFSALLGHCYGRKKAEPKGDRLYATRSGQAFWAEITGDPDFYLELVRLMGEHGQTQEHRLDYEAAWNKAVNRFEREFLFEFATQAGDIDWEKLVEFNSGAAPRRRAPRRRSAPSTHSGG